MAERRPVDDRSGQANASMRRQSDGADFGSWLFKCNPRLRDFQSFAAGADGITEWCVASGYRATLIRAGQPVMLWISGSDAGDPTPGIWAVGQTTSEAGSGVADPSAVGHLRPGRRDVHARLDLRLLDEPVPRAVLRHVGGLERLEVLRTPAGSNPSWVTRSEFEAIQPLVHQATDMATNQPPGPA